MSTQKLSLPMQTGAAGHYNRWSGTVQKASDTSWTAICEPGGRWPSKRNTTAKEPHVQGKFAELVKKLMEELGKEGEAERGKEKFWTILNFPGCPGLGIMEKGEDWKGPIRDSRMALLELQSNNGVKLCSIFQDGRSIGRGLSRRDGGEIENKTKTKTLYHKRVLFMEPRLTKKLLPHISIIDALSLMVPECKCTSGLHGL